MASTMMITTAAMLDPKVTGSIGPVDGGVVDVVVLTVEAVDDGVTRERERKFINET